MADAGFSVLVLRPTSIHRGKHPGWADTHAISAVSIVRFKHLLQGVQGKTTPEKASTAVIASPQPAAQQLSKELAAQDAQVAARYR